MIYTIVFINCYTFQTATAGKGTRSDRGHTTRNDYTCQTVTPLKGIISDRGHAVRNDYACQTATAGKGILSDRGHTVRNDYACQTATEVKGTFSDRSHIIFTDLSRNNEFSGTETIITDDCRAPVGNCISPTPVSLSIRSQSEGWNKRHQHRRNNQNCQHSFHKITHLK